MEKIKQISRGIFVSVLFLLTACTADEGPIFVESPDNEIVNVSYSADIQPIFNSRCITCHNEFHSTGLNLKADTGYGLLVGVVTRGYAPNIRVKPFSKEESVLWHKISNTGSFGGVMPQIGAPLTPFEIKKIEKWIELGAQNN